MATCNIDLYKCGITKDRNAKIDSLKDFLLENSTQHIEKRGVQRIRHAMKISIKLDISQSEADYQGVDYCQIENTDSGRRYYYFIDSCMQLAQRTVQFNLTLDTINTFFDEMTFTDRTFVEREHKDRFERFVKSSSSSIRSHRRKIDRTAEENAPLKYLKKKNKIAYNEPDFYLVYTSSVDVTAEATGVITVTAYPDEPIGMGSNIQTFVTPSSASDRHTYALLYKKWLYEQQTGLNETGDSITLRDSTHSVTYKINSKGKFYDEYIYHQGSDKIVYKWYKKPLGVRLNTKEISLGFTPTEIQINAKMYYFNESRTHESEDPTTYTDIDIVESVNTPKTIDQLDRADSKLLKIIALPYAPFRVAYDENGNIPIPSGWFVNTDGILTLSNQYAEFEQPIGVFDFDELAYSLRGNEWGDTNALRNDGLESKIFHSDFYERALVYDSFQRSISLERLKRSEAEGTPTEANAYKVTIYYKPTSTINSKFAFKFKFYDGNYTGFYWLDYDMIEPFENFLVCERNNELSIFTNNYVNYLRTGYNYDLKNKKLQSASAVLGGLGSVVNSIGVANISNKYLSTGLDVGRTLMSTVVSSIAQQNAFEQKQAEMKNQKTGVSGSNDLDLLQYYSDNKAFDCTYELSSEQKNNFLNLFYYCGYAVNEMRKPVFANRYWFNFLKCNPQFTNVAAYITNDYIADISSRLQEGVTIYHEHNGKWDFEQALENWETWMV